MTEVCKTKTRYTTKAQALEISRKISRPGRRVTPYTCPACGAYHLTHARTNRRIAKTGKA